MLMTARSMGTTQEIVHSELDQARWHRRWDDVVRLLEVEIDKARTDKRRQQLRVELAEVLTVNLGRFDAALDVLRPVRAQMHDDPLVNYRSAEALFGAGQLEEAQRLYEWLTFQGAGPSRWLARVLMRLGQISALKGDVEVARIHLKRSAAMDPAGTQARETLALLDGAQQR